MPNGYYGTNNAINLRIS